MRGFRESRLGPEGQIRPPYGGNLLVVGRAELIIPLPEKWATTARASLFYDIGNVFYESNEGHVLRQGRLPDRLWVRCLEPEGIDGRGRAVARAAGSVPVQFCRALEEAQRLGVALW